MKGEGKQYRKQTPDAGNLVGEKKLSAPRRALKAFLGRSGTPDNRDSKRGKGGK